MVFWFRHPTYGVPSAADCRAIADAYGIWENSGFGLGYFSLRGELSYFTSANVYSIDPTVRASFVDTPFARGGLLPRLATQLMATGRAPIVTWGTAARGPSTGRTYAVGLTASTSLYEDDQERISGVYTGALTSIFTALRGTISLATGYIQCHYTVSDRGGLGPGSHLLDITGTGCYELTGSQRRRTRR
jgi:hypothetical protein